jgi:hypothetical protein
MAAAARNGSFQVFELRHLFHTCLRLQNANPESGYVSIMQIPVGACIWYDLGAIAHICTSTMVMMAIVDV